MPSPCGPNTNCQELGGRAVCSCIEGFFGDPQSGCKPECVLNSDCPQHLACFDGKCHNPCGTGGLCGLNAICTVRDHTAVCECPPNYTGYAFVQCIPKRKCLHFCTVTL